MILITVGTEKYRFNRLMMWIDRAIAEGLLNPQKEEIIIQYGSCSFVPQGVTSHRLLPKSEFTDLVSQARIIIAHCGEGTIDLLALMSKPFIVVPRSYLYKEHVDDHQIELAKKLVTKGINVANSFQDLINFLAEPSISPNIVSPTVYYKKASLMLEKTFDTEEALESLTANFLDIDFDLEFA